MPALREPAWKAGLRPAVEFLELEADAHNERGLAGNPVAVGGGDDGAVGEEFDCRIGAIAVPATGVGEVLHQAHPALAFAALNEVFVGPNPGEPVPAGGCDVGRISEADEQPPVRGVDRLMSIAGQGGRQLARHGPGHAFVVGEDDERVSGAAVFTQ